MKDKATKKRSQKADLQEVVVLGNYCCYSGRYLWKHRSKERC